MDKTEKNILPILSEDGLQMINSLSWGAHFCQFYKTKQDLIDILVPYFKAGLENNQFCMWVTSEPLEKEEAQKALLAAEPDLADYFAKGQIEILSYNEWYTIDGGFDAKRVLSGWVKKCEKAMQNGFSGLRLTGNTFWLERRDWANFADYEEEVNKVIGNYKIIAACTYSLERCSSEDVIDVMRHHQFAIIKNNGEWEVIATQANREREKHLASFPEVNPNQIIELDCDGKVNYINPSARRLLTDLGMDESAVHVFFPGNLDKILVRLKDGQNVERCDEVKVRLGSRFFVSAVAFPAGMKFARAYIRESTKRKQAEALAELETRRLKTAESIAKLGSWELDLLTGVLYWSDEAFFIFEIDKKKFGASYDAFLSLIHPDDREKVDKAYSDSLASRRPYKIVHRLKFPDGRVKFVIESCETKYNPSGKPIVSFGYVQDITEQELAKGEAKKNKDLAEKNTNRLRAVLDAAPTIIFIVNDRKCLDVVGNGEAYKFLRVAPGTNLSKSGRDKDKLKHYKIARDGKILPLKQMPMQYVVHTGKPLLNFEYDFVFDDGTTRTLFGNVTPVLDNKGQLAGAVGSFVDITERKRVEMEIKNAKDEWERTFDSVPDLIAILDKHHRIIRANRAMLERLNTTNKDCAGLNCFKCVHGTNRPPGYCPHTLTLKDGKVHTVDVHEDRLGGDFKVSTTPLFDKSGKMTGTVHVARDITEAKNLERAKTEFISLAAHQLRTPLTTIKLTVEMLLLGLGGQVDKSNRKYLRDIVEDVNKMTDMAELFLNISRIDVGTFEIKPRRVSIFSVIDNCLKLILPQSKQKGIVLKEKISAALPRFRADVKVMNIILENLLSNAVKYSAPGQKVLVSAKKIGRDIVIAVIDHGYGIPKEHQDRIFEQFFRANNVKDIGIEGNGLGLYMVKLLVEISGGKIWFDSAINSGAAFYVSWPITGMKKNSASIRRPRIGALGSYCARP